MGTFLLNWIWGIGNKTYIAFLVFVPIVNVIMLFVLGAKGSEWAWSNKRWVSVEEFKDVQRKWALWGLVLSVLFVILFVCGLVFTIFYSLKNSEAYEMTVKIINSKQEAIEVLGEPVSTGIPAGSIRVSGPDGEASISFSAEGSKGNGTVYLKASKSLGQWKLNQAVLEDSGSGRRIDLLE